jgi:predicted transcriptional regulator
MMELPRLGLPRFGQARPTLSEDEEQSLLRRIGRKTLGGLAGVGNLLDLPGSMVRDILAGQNPVDQIVSPFSAENRTTGRDLLRGYGLAGRRDTWGNAGAGFAAEIALDPLTYLTFGASALSKAGKAAKSAGMLDDAVRAATRAGKTVSGPRTARMATTLDDLLKLGDPAAQAARTAKAETAAQKLGTTVDALRNETLGRPIGVGVPFTDWTMPLKMPGEEHLAKGLDVAGNWLRYSTPVRHLYGGLSPTMKGAVGELAQKFAPQMTQAEREGAAGGRMQFAEVLEKLGDNPEFSVEQVLRTNFGGVSNRANLLAARDIVRQRSNEALKYSEGMPGTNRPAGAVGDALDDARQKLDQILADEQHVGLNLSPLQDVYAKYWPRHSLRMPEGIFKRIFSGRAYSPKHSFEISRETHLKNLREATSVIQDLSVDDQISGLAKRQRDGKLTPAQSAQIKQHIRQVYEPRIVSNAAMPGTALTSMTDAEVSELANWAAHLDPRYADEHVPIFGLNPFEPLLSRMEQGGRATGVAKAIYQLFGETAGVAGRAAKEKNLFDTVSSAFTQPGRDMNQNAWSRLREALENGSQEAQQAWQDAMQVGQQMQAAGKIVTEADLMKHVWVSQDVADDVTRIMQGIRGDEATKGLTNAIDEFLKTWKTAQTTVAPAFHVRNRISGLAQSWFGNALDTWSIPAAFKLSHGKAPDGLLDRIPQLRQMGATTDAEAGKLVQKLAFAHQVAGYGTSLFDEIAVGNRNAAMRLPGEGPLLSQAPVGSTGWQRANPLDAELFAPARIGRDIGNRVETMNRLEPFITLLGRGWSPEAAAKRVKLLQVDYGAEASLDPFLRRVFPFWKFMKGVTLPTAEMLMERPGGRLGTTIKAAARARKPEDITPDYVAETTSIPLGTLPDGSKRYLTGLGMMFEDPLSFGVPIPGVGTGVKEAALEGLSRLNPMLKAPLEWGAGQSFFQKGPMGGRPIEDVDPTIGRILSNVSDIATGQRTYHAQPFLGSQGLEYLATNMIGRPLTTLRTVTDPRKWQQSGLGVAANTLTGFRVSDVSEGAQDAVIQDAADALMKQIGAREFSKMYFPEDVRLQMSPARAALADQWMGLQKVLDQRAKTRKELRARK